MPLGAGMAGYLGSSPSSLTAGASTTHARCVLGLLSPKSGARCSLPHSSGCLELPCLHFARTCRVKWWVVGLDQVRRVSLTQSIHPHTFLDHAVTRGWHQHIHSCQHLRVEVNSLAAAQLAAVHYIVLGSPKEPMG
jgi:hypothetical protein